MIPIRRLLTFVTLITFIRLKGLSEFSYTCAFPVLAITKSIVIMRLFNFLIFIRDSETFCCELFILLINTYPIQVLKISYVRDLMN